MRGPDRWWHRALGSIRRRLLVALLLPMGVVLLATAPQDFRFAVTPAQEAYDDVLLTEAQALAEQVQAEQGRATFHLNPQAERLLRSNAGDIEYFAVRAADGTLLGGDGSLPGQSPVGAEPLYSNIVLRDAAGAPQPLRMVSIGRGSGAGQVVVQVAETLHKRHAAERRILAAMVLPNVLIAMIGAVLIYAATRVALVPIEQLAHQVAERSPDDLRAIELKRPPTELLPVLNALNRLFERVQGAARTQQRFHANVAHQLRTPLTGLRTQIELAQMDGAFRHDAARSERILSAIDRLTHLIDQLLTLSRAEAGLQDALRRVPVDLQAVIEERASELVDPAIDRGIDLGFQLAPAAVQGVPLLLGELVNNLVDNALRYCPRGSVVTVACGETGGRPWLAVEDNGPGIAPPQRARVFDRFQRGPASEAEGSGLGLAIVQEIAQLHGATVRALTPERGSGVRFEVRW